MKKRVKLFTTIASLCLAVALMAFGVYAAANVTYNVNGTVSYSMTDVLVEVTTNLYASELTAQNATKTTVAELKAEGTMKQTADKTEEFTTVNTNNVADDTLFDNYDDETDTGTVTHGDFEYNLNNASIYVLEVKINVLNDSGVKVTPDWTPVADVAAAGYEIVAGVYDDAQMTDAGQLTLAKGEHTLEFAVVLRDVTKTAINAEVNFVFTMVQA